jgi:GxxExxY protein
MNRQDRQGRQEEPPEELDRLARSVVDAGFQVHKALGPGLLESAYETCLAFELKDRGLSFRRQVILPVTYRGNELDAGYRLDLLVEEQLILEIKAVDALTRVHEAQVLTYLKLSGHPLALLMNFNVDLYKRGVRRFVR